MAPKSGHLRTAVACLAAVIACALPASAAALVYVPATVGSPTAAFTVGVQAPESGQSVSFDGSSSTDVGAPIVSYVWRFGDGGRASGARSTHTYSTPGSYSASLTVVDSSGRSSSVTNQIVVSQGPTAAFALSPTQTFDRTPITFDATGSVEGAAGASIQTYSWSFGDGTTGTGATAMHTYATPGTYAVRLTVVDSDGARSTVSRSVIAADQPPVAVFAPPPGLMTVAQPIALDAGGSSDAEGAIAAYAWNFGDGSTGTGRTIAHTYGAPGSYSVTLTVRDSRGQTTTTTHDLAVHAPPEASFTFSPALPRELATTTFDAGATVNPDPATSLSSYRWSFGDGATSSDARVTHTYARAGTYIVTLAVADGLGLTDTTTTRVTVAHAVPTALITVRATQAVRGQQVRFTGSSSHAADEATVTYTWRFGDGGSAAGRTPAHAYAHAGRYVVTLTVSDSFGDVTTATATVVVSRRGAVTGIDARAGRTRASMLVAAVRAGIG